MNTDGTKYKDYYFYACKHRTLNRGHKCDYRKQINEELLDEAVVEVIRRLVSDPKFAQLMQERIDMKIDTAELDKEIKNYIEQLRKAYGLKEKLVEEMNNIDPDDKADSGEIYDSVDDELIEYQHMLVQRLNDFNNTLDTPEGLKRRNIT